VFLYSTLKTAPVIFNISYSFKNVIEENNWECTFDIEETESYSVDLSMEARGFITALRIIDENGELAYQNLGEDFSFTTRVELDKGKYTLSLTYLVDEEAVEDFLKSIGQEERNLESVRYVNEAFSHNNEDYSAVFSLKIR
ncbi:MAG TPA: hypothetical protein VN512_06445, partial [Clostridia bacterium]|nr:hypothetical protein [Clostridia bacterium]